MGPIDHLHRVLDKAADIASLTRNWEEVSDMSDTGLGLVEMWFRDMRSEMSKFAPDKLRRELFLIRPAEQRREETAQPSEPTAEDSPTT